MPVDFHNNKMLSSTSTAMSTDWNLIFYDALAKHLQKYIDACEDSALHDCIIEDCVVEIIKKAEIMPNDDEVKKDLQLSEDLTQVSFLFHRFKNVCSY